MSKVLVLNSSALGGASVSNQVVKDGLAELRARDPGLIVTVRDLGANPIPHLNIDSATAVRGAAPANEAQAIAQGLSDTLIAELKAADTIVIGAPMYNFSVPSALKAWIDHVVPAGRTFRYGASGPEGLLRGKKVFVVTARGGVYSQGPGKSMDFHEPYLRGVLGFIGLTDVSFIYAEGLAMPEHAAKALETARASFSDLLPKAA